MGRHHRLDTLKSQLLAEQGGVCFYCRELLTYMRAVAEHKTPVSRGGSSMRSNMAASCRKCDNEKGSKTAEEYLHPQNKR